MARTHPFERTATGDFKFKDKRRKEDFLQETISEVRSDEDYRNDWMLRQEDYYERRYSRMFRNTNFPWPGASDIVMPTIDMTIDRLKATMVQLILTKPLVTFENTDPKFSGKSRSDEIYFNWHLMRRMPDFKQQVIFGVDNMLQYGHAIFKVYWDYRTRNAKRYIDFQNLPARYGALGQQLWQQAIQQAGQANPSSLSRPSPGDSEAIAETVFAQVAQQIGNDYGIDLEEKEGKATLRNIVSGLKGRAGKDGRIVYKVREVEANNARIVALDIADFIVPGGSMGIQDADRLVQRLWLSPETFEQRARDHRWDARAVADTKKSFKETREKRIHRSRRESLDWIRESREGVQSIDENDFVEVWEVHFHKDIDGDGVAEKVWTVIQPDTGAMLKPIREEPYAHAKWPFVQAKFELNDPRFHSSRGVPEKIDDLDIEITKVHRAKLNNLDLMAPTFQYRQGSEINPDNFNFRPGGMYSVQTMGDIAPLDVPDRTIPNEREENSLLTWNERYIGSLENVANQNNISEARTATEVRALQTANRVTLSHRGIVLQIAMGDVYDQCYDIINQYAPDEEYQKVTGGPFERFTSLEFRNNMSIIPVGTIDTSDPVLEAQKAFARFQTLLNLWVQNGGNPILNGTHFLDINEALIRWLERDNVLDARAILRALSPEEIQQLQQAEQERNQRKQDVEDNIPRSIEDIRAEVAEIKKSAPHGNRQRIATPA